MQSRNKKFHGSSEVSLITISMLSGTVTAAGDRVKIYYSTDAGSTWLPSASTATGGSWSSISTSYNGKTLLACGQNSGGLFISRVYGSNWACVYIPGGNGSRSGAISSDGTYFAAGRNTATGAILICK